MQTQNEETRLQEVFDSAMAALVEMVAPLLEEDDYDDETQDERREEAIEAIEGDPLSVMVRDGWRTPYGESTGAEEFEILLSTGGPASRIVGTLGAYSEPDDYRLEVQHWFEPWTTFPTTQEQDDALAAYVARFYFGE